MNTEELFDRCLRLAQTVEPTADTNRLLHETLVLCCAEGLRDTGQGYGNLFSQVDFLCKRHGIGMADRVAIQTMRRHSNGHEPTGREDLLYDVRALCLLVSAVFGVAVPDALVRLIPAENRPQAVAHGAFRQCVRCIVSHWDDRYIHATTDDGELAIDYTWQEHGVDLGYLRRLVRKGMQLNLLDAVPAGDGGRVLRPRLVVVEPDFLVDISSIAACFTDYGHHPLLYTLNRLQERPNTQAILLGNFAGSALDDLINGSGSVNDTMAGSFREQALQFCTCEGFRPEEFVRDAHRQAQNLREVIATLFGQGDGPAERYGSGYRRERVILEPSFICERLGLQGRVDMMTTDLRLLVEQKSGKNMNIERGAPNVHREAHYVQLLLYYGVLHYNFGVSDRRTDIRLLYSRYPAAQGLVVVNFYSQLFREAIKFRNRLVATEYAVARDGFGRLLPHLRTEVVYGGVQRDAFFVRYIEPRLAGVAGRLAALTPLERAYYCRMMTFVYREQLYAKVGAQEGRSSSIADLWNMPLHEKQETGNIYTGLTITGRRQSAAHSGYDLITLAVPHQGEVFLPNFRRGDAVCLYAYEGEPDVCRAILHKGVILHIGTDELVVRLNDGQQNPDILHRGRRYAVEHGSSDASTGGSLRSLYAFITGDGERRALLLGQRPPGADAARRLSRSYHADYDEVLLKALQAEDYFLLVGPPGTGKTSMALRFMVEEWLARGGFAAEPGGQAGAGPAGGLLLMSYTNRAVDEICDMLEGAGVDYLRIGLEASCDPRFRSRLLDAVLGDRPQLDDVRQRLLRAPVIVGTTSMMQSRSSIFRLKRFGLAIVDEASQILEPGLVGLLSQVPKFILIGDHKQLPAVVQQPEAESRVAEECLHGIGLYDCRHSLFERLIRWEERCGRSRFTGTLRKQGRMHPDIAAFPNRMFYRKERLEPVPCAHQTDTSLHYDLSSEDALDDLLKTRRVLFLPAGEAPQTAGPAAGDAPQSDKVSPAEARIVADLLRRIFRFYGPRFDAARTVGVIVPYRNQIAMIRKEIDRLSIPALADVSIDTVERYQGSQRDVIIYSFTVRYGYQLDFLTSNCFVEDGHTIDRKLNVAITRARKQLLMTGHEAVLRQNAVFAELIDFSR